MNTTNSLENRLDMLTNKFKLDNVARNELNELYSELDIKTNSVLSILDALNTDFKHISAREPILTYLLDSGNWEREKLLNDIYLTPLCNSIHSVDKTFALIDAIATKYGGSSSSPNLENAGVNLINDIDKYVSSHNLSPKLKDELIKAHSDENNKLDDVILILRGLRHDFKTIAAFGSNLTQFLEFYSEEPEVVMNTRYLKSTKSILTLAEDTSALIDAATATYNGTPLVMKQENIGVLVKEESERCIYKNMLNKVNFEYDISPNVTANTHRILIQGVYNFLSNANKYAPKGDTVLIKVYDKDNYANIEVIDHGMALSKEEGENIFQGNKQLKRHADEKIEGSHTGLSIVKGYITKLLNGEMGVRPLDENKGNIFYIKLPM